MEILDTPTARELPYRPGPALAIILHSTGETDLDAILKFYDSPDGYEPHYLVETTSTVRRFVAEDRVAYHAKIEPLEAALYARGWDHWSAYRWSWGQPVLTANAPAPWAGNVEWGATWRPAASSPLDLITGPRPNFVTIGIELQEPLERTPDHFLDVQYQVGAELVADVARRQGIALERRCLLGHYDVSPLRRSTSLGSWDPGKDFNWNRFIGLARLAAAATTTGRNT